MGNCFFFSFFQFVSKVIKSVARAALQCLDFND